MTIEPAELRDFARRYTEAWCSGDPVRVAEHYAADGALTINGGTPSVGRAAITEAARSFMDAFPDMRVLMDDVRLGDAGSDYHWILVGTNTGPRRYGESRPDQRLGGMDARRRRPHRRLAGPLRPGRIRPANRAKGTSLDREVELVK